ncbi:ras guanine nucleotide exchange factor domain-containing protein [Zychaea mexicana]|uniref:ras guanine nucleotide exchange factor domain-containing protein n=1 Tax=Zychaea mexicana TaxID=64656 RepID=UPI0022FE0AB4|nr:ras guanine nucleotide exchange factor domain-containing protein [Zychaea mexicana]KAI9493737.1 ras guanine nucleotide exchange factor domain-containing protein [Zychaea mexicana]
MSSNDVICRVCALYPYVSTDASSLSFEQGAVIDVLAQLDSGWWDGWCNGKRGWFPSNYVQVIPEDTSNIESLHSNNDITDDASNIKDAQFWNNNNLQQAPPPQHHHQHHHQTHTQDQWTQKRAHRQSRQQPLETEQQQQQQRHLRLSLATSDVLTPATDQSQQIPQPLPVERSDWILQTTEDGSEVYYYNVVTKEMRYSVPTDDPTYKLPPTTATNGYDPTMSPPASENYRSIDYGSGIGGDFNSDHDEFDETRPMRSLRGITNTTFDSQSFISAGTTTSSSNSLPSVRTNRSGNDDQLPPNWVRKSTPKGREYYCNLITDETTWTLDHVDPQSGTLLTPASPQTRSADDMRLSLATMGGHGNRAELPQSWGQLSALIAHAIRNLKGSVKQGQIGLFREDALLVVQHIRLLLYVSNSVDKESSPYLKINKQLKTYHRALLAALAKLVLSARVASGAWPPSEAIGKLQLDADEVLMAVRNFLTIAQEMRIEVHDSKPKLLREGTSTSRWRTTSGMNGNKPDAMTTLLVLADNVHGAIASFMDSAREAFTVADDATVLAKIQSSTPLLVAQFRNLSNTTSQFLNSVEDISNGHLAGRTSRFNASKQSIHNAMGSLFIASQSITNQDIAAEKILVIFDRIETSVKTIEASVQDICSVSHQAAMEASTKATGPVPSPPTSLTMEQPGAGRRPSHDYATRPNFITGNNIAAGPPSRISRLDGIDEERRLANTAGGNPTTAETTFDRNDSAIDDFVESRQQPKDKLAKFFGEDTLAASRRRDTIISTPGISSPGSLPSTSTSAYMPPSERSDYLGSEYNPNEIIFNMEGNVKGGTVTALVQRLTQHDQLDSKFITTFLLTYRSFCTTPELFDALFKRYTLPPPMDLTQEELENWQEKKLKLVRLRVFNVLKSWLEHYYNEEEDRPMLPLLYEFNDNIVRESMQFGAEQLIKLIRKRMDTDDAGQIKKMTLNVRASDMPQPILPKNMKRLRFLDIDPLELARQLTIMDSKLYSRIKPVECLDKNWGKGDADNVAANVKASIEYSNQVTAWVTDSILSKDEVKKRAAVVKHWITVAEKCRLLNNYNTCMAILSAFDNSSIGRMKRTWELMNARTTQTLTGIRRLMGANKNFNEYRDIIHKVNPPCIPFLGIYLQDLTFIEDGNSNYLKKSNHLINFGKRMKTAEVIRELQQYQSTPYLLQAVPDIQEFIKTHLQSSRDEETLYNLSLTLEPRERGEDTIARRLKESGL